MLNPLSEEWFRQRIQIIITECHLIIDHNAPLNIYSCLSGPVNRSKRNTRMDRIGKKVVKCKWKLLWGLKQTHNIKKVRFIKPSINQLHQGGSRVPLSTPCSTPGLHFLTRNRISILQILALLFILRLRVQERNIIKSQNYLELAVKMTFKISLQDPQSYLLPSWKS